MFTFIILSTASASAFPDFSIEINGNEVQLEKPSCQCDARFEIMHVQDFSRSFDELLQVWKNNADSFVEAFNTFYPDSRYGLTGFVDKPLPFLGHGFGDYDKDFRQDYCYKRFSDFVPVGSEISDLINSLPPSTGGNDLQENQFEALINTALDSNISWTDGEYDADGTKLIKVAALITNSTAHGLNLSGQEKPSGNGKWADISNATRGYDLWWSAQNWDYSYGKEFIASQPDNQSYTSGIWSTQGQFKFSENCSLGSTLNDAYYTLGEKLNTTGLSAEEMTQWEEVKVACGPHSFYEYLGKTEDPDQMDMPHPGVFTEEDECTTYEYPNQDQVATALLSKGITPVVLTPDTGNIGGFQWYQWAYGCTRDEEHLCVTEFYEEVISHTGMPSYVSAPAKYEGNQLGWIIELFSQLAQIYNDQCECPAETTTEATVPAPTFPTTTEATVPAPTFPTTTEATVPAPTFPTTTEATVPAPTFPTTTEATVPAPTFPTTTEATAPAPTMPETTSEATAPAPTFPTQSSVPTLAPPVGCGGGCGGCGGCGCDCGCDCGCGC